MYYELLSGWWLFSFPSKKCSSVIWWDLNESPVFSGCLPRQSALSSAVSGDTARGTSRAHLSSHPDLPW